MRNSLSMTAVRTSVLTVTVCAILSGCNANKIATDPQSVAFPPSLTVPLGLGIDDHFEYPPKPGELAMMHATGFTWVRTHFQWEKTERAKGQYDFSFYDNLVPQLEANGLHPYFVLGAENKLYPDHGSPYTNKGQTAFAAWAAAAAAHFKGHQIVWEILNEPSDQGEWKSVTPTGATYGRFAVAVSQAIRSSDPNAIIVGPALGGRVNIPFLQNALAQGVLNNWDAVSIHPYQRIWPPEHVLGESPAIPGQETYTYPLVKPVINQYANGKMMPLLSGEWGYPTDGSGAKFVTDDEQAAYLQRMYLINLMSGVPVTIWYEWQDEMPTPNSTPLSIHMGIVQYTQNGIQPKPAYTAITFLTTFLNGFTYNARRTSSSDDYLLSFTKNGETRYVAWTTAAPHSVFLTLQPSLCMSVSDDLGSSSQVLRTDIAGNLTLPLSDHPQFLKEIRCQ